MFLDMAPVSQGEFRWEKRRPALVRWQITVAENYKCSKEEHLQKGLLQKLVWQLRGLKTKAFCTMNQSTLISTHMGAKRYDIMHTFPKSGC
jgi:hypothetical protein